MMELIMGRCRSMLNGRGHGEEGGQSEIFCCLRLLFFLNGRDSDSGTRLEGFATAAMYGRLIHESKSSLAIHCDSE